MQKITIASLKNGLSLFFTLGNIESVANLTKKTIVPFTTSMSTLMSSSMPYIRRMASKDRARVLNGFRYTGNNTALANWIRE